MNNINKKQIDKIVKIPMGDDDIRYYFDDAKIIKYSDLNKFNNINQIIPNNNDYLIILYQDSPRTGHWCLLTKNNGVIEFFDPYGGKPDSQLKWVGEGIREDLGIYKPFLTELLNKSKNKIIYNSFDYQEDNDNINTCGRHCCFRLLNLLTFGIGLKDYNDLMKELKKIEKLSYDEIVSKYINKIQ